jgi:type II secretory pathway pseudopilin PulG
MRSRISQERTAFSIVELFAVIAVIGIVLALILPVVQRARETARMTACTNNLKQITLALLNYEDKHKFLPPISTNTDSVADIPGDPSATTDNTNPEAGTAPSKGAGFSWMVLILPEFCGNPLYQSIYVGSNKFTLPAFSSLVDPDTGATIRHPATLDPEYGVRCPSFASDEVLDTTVRIPGVAGGAIETGAIPPNYAGGLATAKAAHGLVITNYNAMLGTHIDIVADANFPARSASLSNSNNGGMKFRGSAFDQGMKLSELIDGKSKVPLVVETRERRFASWYDGTINWVVAARHSNPLVGTVAITAASKNHRVEIGGMAGPPNRWWIGRDGTHSDGGSALNYGPTVDHPTAVYLPTASLADPDISGIAPGRLWGPSSQHNGGIVNHAFGDAHVESISDQIDPNVYLWIVTRNGGEAIPAD